MGSVPTGRRQPDSCVGGGACRASRNCVAGIPYLGSGRPGCRKYSGGGRVAGVQGRGPSGPRRGPARGAARQGPIGRVCAWILMSSRNEAVGELLIDRAGVSSASRWATPWAPQWSSSRRERSWRSSGCVGEGRTGSRQGSGPTTHRWRWRWRTRSWLAVGTWRTKRAATSGGGGMGTTR